jgi:hypothetical protein
MIETNRVMVDAENDIPESWVKFPRDILYTFQNDEICRAAYFILLHLRLTSNPYGVAITSFDNLNNDLFNGQHDKSYINKLLLELKSQKLLWYPNRQGKRGSFKINFGGFPLKNNKETSIAQHFKKNTNITPTIAANTIESEVNTDLSSPKQNFKDRSNNVTTIKNTDKISKVPRSNKNNIDKDIKNNTEYSVSNKVGKLNIPYKPKTLTSEFSPSNEEEFMAHEIAKKVGEPTMDFILSFVKRGKLGTVEKAYGELEEDITAGKNIDNKGAYFNGILRRMFFEKKLRDDRI